MMSKPISRRRFLERSAVAGGVGVLSAAGWSRVYGANERLRVAAIGVWGKGWSDHTSVAASPYVDIVSICDIDEGPDHLGRAAKHYPKAATATDWRKVLDKARDIDAVIISTPDHMHAPISLAAMQLGKHVFCQKPLAHTVFETRQMQLAAAKNRVVTQMGNQIQSHTAYRTAVKLVHDGVIGKVKEVHSWQSGPLIWMLVDERPTGSDPVPATLHWDEWLGVAPTRPYKEKIYHPFNWRAWQDFSTGQIGDFACHILDPVFKSLELTAPTTIRGEAPPLPSDLWTRRSTVQYEFPGTARTAGKTIKVTWYDGEGHFPPQEALGLKEGTKLPTAGSLLIGEKGSLVIPHVAAPRLLPEEQFADFKIETVPDRDHYVSWADACRGEGQTTSNFDYSAPLTETVLLGSIAIRNPEQELRWDAGALKITNNATANAMLKKPYRKGWEPAWVS
ncbi:Tat (twin-arginine translocation) pathway signal sequence [Singulisphaera sp. GP187]|uniref:Gfo/Idh/MocA family protein n=1 Tax=Singulisphaera sp. GP187 TaxID=1882752 RepID=UPI0009289D6E|nr:Gfo/Idh/MocA family oxidoreductase [Singulisphaera sp. GP187]SIO60393.1 Tat (twin-arginine translocation) pathway signal sequence [Singulisphaera sp. GP187]